MNAAYEGSPTFGTVLVARTSNDSPSDLERYIRQCCSRLRVVEKLSGGAHLLLPGSETTIAVRAYFPKDLEQLESGSGSLSFQQQLEEWHQGRFTQDLDGLVAFRDAFKYPVVFFILPPGPTQTKQLSCCESFVQRAQMIMNSAGINAQRKTEGSARVFIVPDTASAIQSLSSVADALKPERCELKKKYYDQVRSKFFIPDPQTGHFPSANGAPLHVATAFRAWAERFSLPAGEADVLMSVFGNLANIASADHTMLEGVPIDQPSKEILHGFFGSEGRRNNAVHGTMNPHPEMDVIPQMREHTEVHTPASAMGAYSNTFLPPTDNGMAQGSIVGLMQGDDDMDWTAGSYPSIHATPRLLAQQYTPRYASNTPSVQHVYSDPVMRHGVPSMTRSHISPRQLEPRFGGGPMANRSPAGSTMRNRIQATAPYSSASVPREHPMQGRYRETFGNHNFRR